MNALASVKNEIHNSVEKIKKNKNITQNYDEIFTRKLSIVEAENNFFEIKLHAPFFAKKAKAGNVLKFQVFGKESIAITIAKIAGEVLTLYLENSNSQTSNLVESIASGRKIHINGINCSSFPEIPENCTVVACEKARLVFGEIFKNHKIITPQEFIECSTVLVYYNKNKKMENFFIATHPNSLPDVSNYMQNNSNGSVFLYHKMNCMLGGICGRCIKPDGTYACIDNIAKL